MKIQEMAFVLVAILILFAIIAIFYIQISMSGLKTGVEDQRSEEANELVRKMAATPEFAFSGKSGCDNCVDLDKLMVLKDRAAYKGFWNLDYLEVESIFPNKLGECTKANFPDCRTITLINNSIGTTRSAYVALCRQEFNGGNYVRCDIGRIVASGKSLSG